MEPIIIECKWIKRFNLPYQAIMLWPFIMLDRRTRRKTLINHELIHFKQAEELLIVPFYVIYILNYLINLIRFGNHSDAYLKVIFEIEACRYSHNLNYIKTRKPYAWLR